jgi:hypothetical protein
MRKRSLMLAAAASLALCCTGCDVSNFDLDGDGNITLDEVFSAIGNFVCGPDMSDGSDGSTDGGTGPTDDGTGSTDGSTPLTPDDMTPTDMM